MRRLIKTTNIRKTKENETKAWFTSSFMSSGQEMDQAHFTAAASRTWQRAVTVKNCKLETMSTRTNEQHATQVIIFHRKSTSLRIANCNIKIMQQNGIN